jgi:hypothetical protein
MTIVSFSPWKALAVAVKLAKNAKRIKNLVERVIAARKAKNAQDKADRVADAGGKCRGKKCDKPGVCFAPGTLVHTDRGAVPIEQLAAGDLVLSRNDQTGEEAYRPIAQTFVTPDQPLLALALEDSLGGLETVEVTAPHPFYVEDRGWVAAGDLAPGDQIVSSGGGRLRVAKSQDTSRRTTVYNFEVEDFHTYFVGESAAWVHNDCPTPTDRLKEQLFERPGKGKGQTTLDAARRELAGEQTGFDHVTKVRNAQRGLVNRIEAIKRQLGHPGLSDAERTALQQELGEASRLLDHSRGFVP